MSYCRFRNTVSDLRDCYRNFDSVESQDEAEARLRLFKICKDIIRAYGDDAHEVPEWLEKEASMTDDELYDRYG